MKKLFSFAMILAILISFIGCNENTKVTDEAIEHNCLNDNNIKSISAIQNSLLVSVKNNFNANKNLNEVDFDNAQVVEYTSVDIKGIIADFKENSNKTFVAYYDEDDNYYGVDFILETSENNGIRTTIMSNNSEIQQLRVKANIETNKIIEVQLLNPDKDYSAFAACVGYAWSACMDDPGCRAICLATFPACWSAIVAGCAVSPIAPSEH